MVACMVRDHEAAGSSPATPTNKNLVIIMVTRFFVLFAMFKLMPEVNNKVNKSLKYYIFNLKTLRFD